MNVSPLLIEALKEVWTDSQCENLFWDSPGDGCKLCFVLQNINCFARLIGRDHSTHVLVFVLVHCVWIFLSFLSNLPCRYAVSCQLQQRILPHTVCPVTDQFLFCYSVKSSMLLMSILIWSSVPSEVCTWSFAVLFWYFKAGRNLQSNIQASFHSLRKGTEIFNKKEKVNRMRGKGWSNTWTSKFQI